MPDWEDREAGPMISRYGFNSPFEEFAMARSLNEAGIPTVYVRAIYMTGSVKLEASTDFRRYESHKKILDPEGNRVLQHSHNYITIRGYYNGPDRYVAEHEGGLYVPVDLEKAARRGLLSAGQSELLLEKTKERLWDAGYHGSFVKANDLLIALDDKNEIVRLPSGEPEVIICNFELIWKL